MCGNYLDLRGFAFLFIVISLSAFVFAETTFFEGDISGENIVVSAPSSGPVCGNGVVESGEECDDGNIVSGDGCSSTCITEGGVSSSGGGGGTVSGGGVSGLKATFTTDKELIKVNTKVGETFRISLKINNTHSNALDFKIETNLDDFIIFSEESFVINEGEEKEIFLTFYTINNTEPGVYTGGITISAGGIEKKIPVIFEVESKKILFDITLDIPSKYKEGYAGDDLLLQLTLFNLGEVGKVDVTVIYIIKDFEGNIISTSEDVIAVETQASFSRVIKLPSDIKPGDYVAIAHAKYGNSIGTSTNIFRIKEKGEFIFPYWQYLFSFLIMIIVIIVIKYEYKKLGKSITSYRGEIKEASKEIKKEKEKSIKVNKVDQKLKFKLRLLDKAYSEGHISKESYEKGMKRIKAAHNKLKRKYL